MANQESFEARLRQYCYEAARIAQWEPENSQSTGLDNITPIANRYAAIVQAHSKLTDRERVLRIFRFFSGTAIPPSRNDEGWIAGGIEILQYLFELWSSPDEEDRAFLLELKSAIEDILDDSAFDKSDS